MTLIEYKLLVPKESAELIEALASILEGVMAGKKVEAVTDNLSLLLKAAQGIDKIPLEAKGKNRDDMAALLVKRMMEALDKGSKGDTIATGEL